MRKEKNDMRLAGDVAAELGIGVQTLHYYEREKLIAPSPRTRAGHRLYSNDVVARIHFIRKAQALGLSLNETREILALAEVGSSPCGRVQQALHDKLRDVDRRIAELQAFREELAAVIERAPQIHGAGAKADSLCAIVEAASPPALDNRGSTPRQKLSAIARTKKTLKKTS